MINAGIAAIPTPAQVRAAFPDIDPAVFLGTYIERAKAMLRISYRDMDWFEQTPWFQYARVGRKYAEAAGYRVDYNGSAYSFDYMKREEAERFRARRSTSNSSTATITAGSAVLIRHTSPPRLATGKVTLKPFTEVTGIRRERSGEYVVSTREIDRFGKEVGRAEIGCDELHLSAGVLGTTEILLRARETGALPDLSEEIGRGYGNNGDIMVSQHSTQRSRGYSAVLDGNDQPRRPK